MATATTVTPAPASASQAAEDWRTMPTVLTTINVTWRLTSVSSVCAMTIPSVMDMMRSAMLHMTIASSVAETAAVMMAAVKVFRAISECHDSIMMTLTVTVQVAMTVLSTVPTLLRSVMMLPTPAAARRTATVSPRTGATLTLACVSQTARIMISVWAMTRSAMLHMTIASSAEEIVDQMMDVAKVNR